MNLQALKGVIVTILAGAALVVSAPTETTTPQNPPCYGIVEPLFDLPHDTTG